jgi:hypothetical protein
MFVFLFSLKNKNHLDEKQIPTVLLRVGKKINYVPWMRNICVIANGQENQLCPLDEKHLALFLDKNQLGTYLP